MESVERRFGFKTAQRVTSGIEGSGAQRLATTLMKVSTERGGDVIASQNAPWRVWDEKRTRPSGAADDGRSNGRTLGGERTRTRLGRDKTVRKWAGGIGKSWKIQLSPRDAGDRIASPTGAYIASEHLTQFWYLVPLSFTSQFPGS